MGIEKLVNYGVEAINKVAKENSPKVCAITEAIQGGKEKMTSTLDALASQGAAMVKKTDSSAPEKLNLDLLQKIPREERWKFILKPDDNLIPSSYRLEESPFLLSQDELTALSGWQQGKGLCNKTAQETLNYTLENNPDIQTVASRIDRLIQEAKPLKEDYIVYRGLEARTPDFECYREHRKFIESLSEGQIIDHQSYVATATKLNDYTGRFLTGEATMRIKLPKGTKGLLLRKDTSEFVLPRGAQLKINSIDKKYGVIEAEYVLPIQKPTQVKSYYRIDGENDYSYCHYLAAKIKRNYKDRYQPDKEKFHELHEKLNEIIYQGLNFDEIATILEKSFAKLLK